MANLTSFVVPLALCVLTGFLCLLVYRMSEYVRALPTLPRRRVVAPRPIETQQSFEQAVAKLTPAICKICGTPGMMERCEQCGTERQIVPASFNTARKGFANVRRNFEANPELWKQEKPS